MWVFLNKVFYRAGLLALRPTPKLEDHPSSDVRDCLFNLFAAILLIGGLSSIRNLRTRHAVVTGTLVGAVMNLRFPWNAGNFLTSCKPVSFSRRALHHGVSVKVVLGIQHALRMCRIISPSVACPAVPNFSTLSHKWYDSLKQAVEHKFCVSILSTTFVPSMSYSKNNSARYCHKCTHAFM